MLHIILGILKIIGIILLIIISLVLLIILSTLFVPVRYRLTAQKNENNLYGQVRLTWLLHLISFSVEYKENHPLIMVRLFGMDFNKLVNWWKNAAKKLSRKKKTSKKKITSKKKKTKSKKPERKKSEASDLKAAKTEVLTLGTAKTEIKKEELSSGQAAEPQKLFPEKTDSAVWEEPKASLGRLAILKEKIKAFWDRLKLLFQKIKDLASSGNETAEKIDRIKEKISDLKLQFWDDEAKNIYRKLLGHLQFIWKHFRPRKLKGWIRFGTGAPDITGELTGVIYLLLPASAADLTIIPDFNNLVLETDIMMKGHIRVFHLVRTAGALWFDKEVRRFIRRARAKGGK
ncbi:MAG: hypothetical protein PHR92_05270 [Lachnospiraceae bacterium]|nr:hypothetical protein [Lachnospiraceae bacterium]